MLSFKQRKFSIVSSAILTCLAAAVALPVQAAEPTASEQETEAAAIAKKMSNPVANLISVPFQGNWDSGGGPDGKGSKYTLNIQPVVPIHINDDWNIVSRTILPFITQTNITPRPPSVPADYTTGQTGFGDTTQSFFLSPTKGSIVWGLGPVILIPTSTSPGRGGARWSFGPTGIVLKQTGPWTVGVLANQLWSVGSNPHQGDVNAMYLQPFITYTTKKHTTYALNSETTCNWNLHGNQCAVPINLMATQLLRVDHQLLQVGLGGRYYVSRPDGTAQWGIRAQLIFIFPTGKK